MSDTFTCRRINTLGVVRYIPEIFVDMTNFDFLEIEREQAEFQLFQMRREYEKAHEDDAQNLMFGATVWNQDVEKRWVLTMPIYMK